MNGNNFINWVLRSPFHGILSNGMLLITVTGCKTGRKYTTPVGYYRDDGYLWVITSRDRTWWKNLIGGADVKLLLKRRRVDSFAEPVLDEEEVVSRMYDYLKHMPQAARSLKIRMESGRANRGDIVQTARYRLFVRLKLIA